MANSNFSIVESLLTSLFTFLPLAYDFLKLLLVATVLDSGLHAVDSGFQVLDSSFCQWNLNSGFQSLEGLRTP